MDRGYLCPEAPIMASECEDAQTQAAETPDTYKEVGLDFPSADEAEEVTRSRSLRRSTLRRSSAILVRPGSDSVKSQKSACSSSLLKFGSCDAPGPSDESVALAAYAPAPHSKVGILVHGCHMQADGWEEIVWGSPPHHLGRLPHAILLGLEENADVIVFGTGASVSADGRLEGQYTLDTLLERLPRLHDFHPLTQFPLAVLEKFVRKVSVAELESQNTSQEVRAAFEIFSSKGLGRAFLVSSPTHLPRCLACACQAIAEDERAGKASFEGEINASPSDTCYQGFEAADVVIVEPPHRGDRDKDLDALPFHEMVRRTFKIPGTERAAFLSDFDALLNRYEV